MFLEIFRTSFIILIIRSVETTDIMSTAVQLAAYYERLATFRSIHRMVRGAAHIRSFARNVGWKRAVAEKHAEFMAWCAGVVRACEATESRSHDRKKYNRVLSEARTLADEWNTTLKLLAHGENDVDDDHASGCVNDILETMVIGA